MTTKQHLTRAQELEVGKLIERHLRKEGDIWVYADGWDDEKIAAIHNVQAVNIARYRRQVFGRINRKRALNISNALEAKVFALEKRIEELERRGRVTAYANGLNHPLNG